MRKVSAEKYRDIDFTRATRGPVIPLAPGKTKISIRLDVAHIEQRSVIAAVRLAVRQELQGTPKSRGLTRRSSRRRPSAPPGTSNR
jgi:hypothetical protein